MNLACLFNCTAGCASDCEENDGERVLVLLVASHSSAVLPPPSHATRPASDPSKRHRRWQRRNPQTDINHFLAIQTSDSTFPRQCICENKTYTSNRSICCFFPPSHLQSNKASNWFPRFSDYVIDCVEHDERALPTCSPTAGG